MKVSIIIPVYNVSDYITRCVKSVMNQTFSDLECFIVDDCSTDDSIEKCENLLKTYNGPISFLVIHHNRNRGQSAARNTGTAAATGEYIYYLDGDDEIVPDCIAKMVAASDEYPDAELIQGNMKSIPQLARYIGTEIQSSSYIDSNDIIRQQYFSLGQKLPTVQPVNKLIKTDFLRNNSLYFKEGIIHEDELWMFFLVKKLNKRLLINDVTYIRYTRPNSTMTTATSARTAHYWGIILNEVADNLDEPYYDKQLAAYLQCLLWYYDGSKGNRVAYDKLAIKLFRILFKRKHFSLSFILLFYIFTLPMDKKRKRGQGIMFKKVYQIGQ